MNTSATQAILCEFMHRLQFADSTVLAHCANQDTLLPNL